MDCRGVGIKGACDVGLKHCVGEVDNGFNATMDADAKLSAEKEM
jgi:hypothetical protein